MISFGYTRSAIDVASLREGQMFTLSWGKIIRRSAISLEVWETASHEHYLVGYNPYHHRLIDIISLPEDPQPKERAA